MVKEVGKVTLGPPPSEAEQTLIDKSIQCAIDTNHIVGGTIQHDAIITYEGVSVAADIVVFDSADIAARYVSQTRAGMSNLENLPTLPDGRPYLIFSIDKKIGQDGAPVEVEQSDLLASHIHIYTDLSFYTPIRERLAQRTKAAEAYSALINGPLGDSGQMSGGVQGAAKFAESAQQYLGQSPAAGAVGESDALENMMLYGSLAPHKTVYVEDNPYPIMTVADIENQLAKANFEGSASELAEKAGYVRIDVSLEIYTGRTRYQIEVGGKTYWRPDFPAMPGAFGDPPHSLSYYVPRDYLSDTLGIEV